MRLYGLTILVASADADRLHAALAFAAAEAARGGTPRVHLHELAVALLRTPLAAPSDHRRRAAGLPTLGDIVDEALALGVAISVCQSGLALAGLDLGALDPRVEVDGPIGVLGASDGGRLLVF